MTPTKAIVAKYCVCADDYTLRGRVDPECRCDVWEEAIDEAVAEEREAILAAMKNIDLDRYFNYDQPSATQSNTWSACLAVVRARGTT